MIKVKDPVTGERTVHKKHTTIGFDKQYTNEFGTFIEHRMNTMTQIIQRQAVE